VTGGLGSYSGAVWTKIMPSIPDDWPAEWVSMTKEPILTCFRPPPLLSLAYHAAPPPPPSLTSSSALPPSSISAAASLSGNTTVVTASSLAQNNDEVIPSNKLVSISSDAAQYIEGEDILRPGGLLRQAFLLNETGGVVLPDSRPKRSDASEEDTSTNGSKNTSNAVSLKWCHATSLVDAGGHGNFLAPNGAYSEVEATKRLHSLGQATKLPPKLKSIDLKGGDVRSSRVANILYKSQEAVGGAYYKKIQNNLYPHLLEGGPTSPEPNSPTSPTSPERNEYGELIAVPLQDELEDESSKWYKKRCKLAKHRSEAAGVDIFPATPDLGDRNHGGFSIIHVCAPKAKNMYDDRVSSRTLEQKKQVGVSTNEINHENEFPSAFLNKPYSTKKTRARSSPSILIDLNHMERIGEIENDDVVCDDDLVACFSARTIGGTGSVRSEASGAFAIVGPIIGGIYTSACVSHVYVVSHFDL
jgi:hypothetical protein